LTIVALASVTPGAKTTVTVHELVVQLVPTQPGKIALQVVEVMVNWGVAAVTDATSGPLVGSSLMFVNVKVQGFEVAPSTVLPKSNDPGETTRRGSVCAVPVAVATVEKVVPPWVTPMLSVTFTWVLSITLFPITGWNWTVTKHVPPLAGMVEQVLAVTVKELFGPVVPPLSEGFALTGVVIAVVPLFVTVKTTCCVVPVPTMPKS